MGVRKRLLNVENILEQAGIEKFDSAVFVDATNGKDTYSGSDWEHAFQTIQAALDAVRYEADGVTIDSAKNRDKWVFVAPGVYNEQVLFSGYNIHLVGLHQKIGNIDYGVVINKDEAVTTTCVVGFTGAGIEISGLDIRNAAAIPSLYAPSPGDGCYIHDNLIDGDDTNATVGIQIDDCRNNIIENNRIFNHVTAGIQLGTNGTWFRNSIVEKNHVSGTQGTGIKVVAGTICSAGFGSRISHNYILGTCAVGIHQDSAGAYVLVADNWIQATAAVTDDGTGDCDNHTAS